MSLFDIANKVIAKAYPGKAGWWGAKPIPNYGILRGAIVAALIKAERRSASDGAVRCCANCQYVWPECGAKNMGCEMFSPHL